MASGLPDPIHFFGTTNWSTILKAKASEDEVQLSAMDRLLSRYRRPIILDIRQRRRCAEHEAEELAHRFIHDWLRRDFLRHVSPERGKFRTFVKTCILNFLNDVHAEESALKRGGLHKTASLDATDGEGNSIIDPVDQSTPDDSMDRAWALQVLQNAMSDLENECVAARRGSLFTALKASFAGDPAAETYSAVAVRLGLTEGAVKVASHRLRQRLGDLIAEEVKQTVGSREDWQQELRYLVTLVGM